MTLGELIVTQPEHPLSKVFIAAFERSRKEQQIAKTLMWWTPL